MKSPLLDADTLVVELGGEPVALAGRILADLGARVVRIEPQAQDDPLRQDPGDSGASRYRAWMYGKEARPRSELAAWLERARIVLDAAGAPGNAAADPADAPAAHWLRVTPFGTVGPRAHWRAGDLGILAASGNLFATGQPERAPLRCAEPVAFAHTGPEAVFAALSACASGRRQVVDLSMQETVLVANMGAVGNFPVTGDRGQRKGAVTGRTREIWACADGFVSFGLRGGRARVPSLELLGRLLEDEGLANDAWRGRDWLTYDAKTADEAELRALEEPLSTLFRSRTMRAWYELACESNLMLAPIAGPEEIFEREQCRAREVFHTAGELRGLPARIALVRDGEAAVPPVARPASGGCWEGLRVVEFGSGAAGPIASRYFVENGATVVKVESRERPDFLRAMWAQASPHGLEGSPLFAALNPGKRSITLDLKSSDGQQRAREWIGWADLVLENFAPRAMRSFGLDYDSLVGEKPDLVMVSTCLNGQTGPHRDYPGFGGQGSALAGYNFLTGWPDLEPVGPYGTITDSLAPRFAAALAASALLRRRHHGRGAHIDLSQVEAAVYSLAPWLLHWGQTGETRARCGNRSARHAPHGVFPTRGDDRWIAITCASDEEFAKLAGHLDLATGGWETLAQRHADEDALEAAIAERTRQEDATALAEALQRDGIEAVPVADFGDLFDDPTLRARGHLVEMDHPVLGRQWYERGGFRFSDADGGYRHPTPTLGEHDEDAAGLLASRPA